MIPCSILPIALNDQVELRKLLAALPSECFRADDALGWTYQFWQAQRKDEINDSGKKIGADELAPVTQLFTEDYMVEFLSTTPSGPGGPARLERSRPLPSKKRDRKRRSLPAMAVTVDLLDVFAVRARRDDQDLASRRRHF